MLVNVELTHFYFVILQGSHQQAAYGELGKRYDIEPDLSDVNLQRKLEEIKEGLKREIRKELKIKEGAENLRKATTDKKSLDNVNKMVKLANSKLEELHQELQELNAHLLVATKSNNKLPGKFHVHHRSSRKPTIHLLLGGVCFSAYSLDKIYCIGYLYDSFCKDVLCHCQ